MSDTKPFEFFRNFLSREEGEAFSALLDSHNIPHNLEASATMLDKTIIGDGLVPKAIIKVDPAYFKAVNKIIADNINDLSPEEIEAHYLSQLDNEELHEIFIKPDEWTTEDVSMAQLVLKSRGVPITQKEVDRLRSERFQKIRNGKKASLTSILTYALFIIGGPFLSIITTIAGFGMGYYYAYGKGTDPDGVTHFAFDPSTRTYGKIMVIGGVIVLLVEVVLFYLNMPVGGG